MFIGLVFTLCCIIVTAESQCTDIIRPLSSQCGVKRDGGVCCDYENKTRNDGKPRPRPTRPTPGSK